MLSGIGDKAHLKEHGIECVADLPGVGQGLKDHVAAQEEAYRKVFPELTLRDDSKAKDFWRTSQGGVCYATGTGGTITTRRGV